MRDPKDYIVTGDAVISDVDLDVEEVRLADGRRLTNHLADELAYATLSEVRRRNLIPRA